MLKERDITIVSFRKWQTRYLKKSHKFDIELLKTLEQNYALDAKNGNTFWEDAISKEMENVRWHLKSYQMGSQYPEATNLCNAI